MRKLLLTAFLTLAGLYSTAGATPVNPTTQPAALVITKGGVYTGTYATVDIKAPAGQLVDLERCTFTGPGDCVDQTTPCDLKIWNCTFSTNSPNKAVSVWDFGTVDIEHNLLNGTGGILVHSNGHAKSVNISYNRGNNITGKTGATSRVKTSFIQVYRVYCQQSIWWNHLENKPGDSATEDAISELLAGGANASALADISNNFINGVYNWPRVAGFSGSAIMAFDPGGAFSVVDGGYTHVHDNQVCNSENEAYAMAGANNVELDHNRAVLELSATKFVTTGYRAWNWADKTVKFGTASSFHDNVSCWPRASGKHYDYSIDAPVTNTNNQPFTSTAAAELARWQQKCDAAKICVGPLPK